jgi:hypothetical protein
MEWTTAPYSAAGAGRCGRASNLSVQIVCFDDSVCMQCIPMIMPEATLASTDIRWDCPSPPL